MSRFKFFFIPNKVLFFAWLAQMTLGPSLMSSTSFAASNGHNGYTHGDYNANAKSVRCAR